MLDANIVLAACLDPSMDAKAGAAQEVFRVLEGARLRPAMTQSISDEIERKLHERVGQIVDAIRKLSQEAMPAPREAGETTLDALERLFAKLRKEAPESAGALQLLESRLASSLQDAILTTEDQWKELLSRVAVETTALLAEVQRRRDALNVETIPRPKGADQEKFRAVVRPTDLEHVASLDAHVARRKGRIIFVTMDSELHAKRDEIAKISPNLVVTMPAYVRRRVDRLHER